MSNINEIKVGDTLDMSVGRLTCTYNNGHTVICDASRYEQGKGHVVFQRDLKLSPAQLKTWIDIKAARAATPTVSTGWR